MRRSVTIIALFLTVPFVAGVVTSVASEQNLFQRQNEQLLTQMVEVFGLTDEHMAKIRAIFARSGFIGQGNPAVTVHPVTSAQCQARLDEKHISYSNPEFEKICGSKYLAPLYDPKTQRPG